MTDLYGLFEDPDEQARRRARDMADMITGQRRQAADMRNLGVLSSLGANPLLRGLQQSSMQAANMLGNEASEGSGYIAQAGGQRANRAFQRDMDTTQAQRMDANALRQRGWQVEDRKSQERQAAANRALEREAMGLKAAQDKAKSEADVAGKNAKLERDLAGEFYKLPAVQQAQIITQSHRQLKAASPTGVGDLQKIFAFTNLIDPGSVVKQEDIHNVANTGGLPGAAEAYYKRLMANGTLPDEVRKQLDAEADVIVAQRMRGYEDARKAYSGLAQQYGVDPARAVPDLNLGLPAPAPERVPAAAALPKDADGQPTLAPEERRPSPEWVEWAKENPDDPNAALILQAAGVTP
jgi:hypothetical protein